MQSTFYVRNFQFNDTSVATMLMNADFRVQVIVKDQLRRTLITLSVDAAVRNSWALSRRKKRRH